MFFSRSMVMGAVLGSLCFSLSACSTIFGDNERDIHINAPKGAKVSVDNVVLPEKAPTTATITNMWSPTIITVQQPGCAAKSVTIRPEFQMIGILNILLWPGFIVDAATGDMMKVPQDKRYISLSGC